MKTFSTLLILGAFCSATNAQITLTSTDFGNAGDNKLVSTQLLYMGDFASTGANYNWDFSDLVPTSQDSKVFGPMSDISGLPAYMFGSLAATNYKASYYQNTNIPINQLGGILPVQFDDIYQYTKVTSAAITSIGYSMSVNGTSLPIKSDTIETRYALPLSFNDTYFSRGYTHINMNPIFAAEWTQHRTRSSEADGWGTIVTPLGSYAALRLRHVITESDSINYSGTWIPLPIPTTVEYEWWTNNEKVPLLKITTTQVGGTEQITTVEYRDDVLLALENKELLTAKIFPNPSSDYIQVSCITAPQKIEIVDITGKIVLTDNVPKSLNTYSIIDFDNGTYLVKVISEDKVSMTSIVKN